MSERAAFISAILDHWNDDTPRLVFADWLQEHGDEPRAKFIRFQIEAARLPKSERKTSRTRAQALALEAVYGAEWRQAVGPNANRGRYERGFLTGFRLDLPRSFAPYEQLLAVEPVAFTLQIHAWYPDGSSTPVTPGTADRIAADPFLRAVTEISAGEGIPFGPERFARLMNSPHLGNLKSISVFDDVIGLAGVRAVVDSPSAFTLEELDLNSALQFDDMIAESDETFAAVELIATSPRFASLKRLSLMFNSLGDRSLEALLASKTLPRTLRVELEDNDYDEERFAEELASRFTGGSDGEEDD